MEFNSSLLDKQKWAEFHTPAFAAQQMQIKKMMQEGLIKGIDELSSLIEANAERVKQLQAQLTDDLPADRAQVLRDGITKYGNLTILTNKVCEIYLMLLDVNTYGTFCLLAQDEWDWRAFARHIYTIVYEHKTTVNKQINNILRILQTGVDEHYDMSNLLKAKKDYSQYINETSGYAKQIRVNVDAHFDCDFAERLDMIKGLSYNRVLELFYNYSGKMQSFLHELKPALENFRITIDTVYNLL
jgi:hypothetical protein